MKTTFEVTLKVTLTHGKKNPLVDSNSVKGAIIRGIDAIAHAEYCVYGEGETHPDDVKVEITRLKENGKRQSISTFSESTWGEA